MSDAEKLVGLAHGLEMDEDAPMDPESEAESCMVCSRMLDGFPRELVEDILYSHPLLDGRPADAASEVRPLHADS